MPTVGNDVDLMNKTIYSIPHLSKLAHALLWSRSSILTVHFFGTKAGLWSLLPLTKESLRLLSQTHCCHITLKCTCTIIVLYEALLLLPSVFQLYEIYAHMGWAYQHIDDPELAVRSYTQAIDIITKHKVRTENIGVFLCFSQGDKQPQIVARNSIIRKLKSKLMISVLTYYQPNKPPTNPVWDSHRYTSINLSKYNFLLLSQSEIWFCLSPQSIHFSHLFISFIVLEKSWVITIRKIVFISRSLFYNFFNLQTL